MIHQEKFTPGEEEANFISHLVGASLSLAGMIVLIVFASLKGSGLHVISASIFGASMFLLYLCSTLFHGLKPKKAKKLFLLFDQMAIYLLIAGSYTPLTLLAIKGTLGWSIFGIEWGLAIGGILYTAIYKEKHSSGVGRIKLLSYVIMGLLFVIAIPSLSKSLSAWGLALLITGGIFYIIGIFFFRMEKIRYTHLVWHILVIFGTACHYIVVLRDLILFPV
jgi:hemolysin III